MTTSKEPSQEAKELLSKVQLEPTNWSARKQAALKLYEEECYLEAADTVWNAPDMPSTDVDVAFVAKIVSRARPNRTIRLVYEVLRRNAGKGDKNMAMARAFSLIGLPMLASRFYGAAIASDAKYFDVGFENQSLWYDDSGSLLEAWEKSEQGVKPPFAKDLKVFSSGSINLADLTEDVTAETVNRTTAVVNAPALKPAVPRSSTSPTQNVPPASKPVLVRPASNPVPVRSASAPEVPEKSKPKPMLPPIANPEEA